MDYKLALQLKEAGFPQRNIKEVREINNDTLEPISFPTLEELIEECNGEMKMLHNRGKNDWLAWNDDYALNDWNNKSAKGKTPKIAVAELYIKLNNKQG